MTHLLSHKTLTKLSTALVCAGIFLAPSNLFITFFKDSGYVNGLLVDYLLPKFFLSDVPVLALIAVYFFVKGLPQIVWHKVSIIFGIVFFFIFVRQFFSPYPLASLWYFAKIVEMVLLVLAINHLQKYLQKKWLFSALLVTTLFQSFVGLLQFTAQKSLANYRFLGESNLSSPGGITTAVFTGVEKILPYGTTPHPNILAGVLTVFLIISWQLIQTPKQKIFWLLVAIPTLVTLFLTQSISAWLFLLFAAVYFIIPKKSLQKVSRFFAPIFLVGIICSVVIFSLQLGKVSDTWSWQRRHTLQTSALHFFLQQPVWGTGLNTNAALNERTLTPGEITRFAQPVHHVVVLWLSETGLLGLLLITIVWWKYKKSVPTVIYLLLPIIVLDHYLLTQQIGLLLLAMSFLPQEK